MKIHSYEAGTTQEHILYERRLDHESILLRSGRARGGSREERHTESKIRWWGLCANPDPYPYLRLRHDEISSAPARVAVLGAGVPPAGAVGPGGR